MQCYTFSKEHVYNRVSIAINQILRLIINLECIAIIRSIISNLALDMWFPYFATKKKTTYVVGTHWKSLIPTNHVLLFFPALSFLSDFHLALEIRNERKGKTVQRFTCLVIVFLLILISKVSFFLKISLRNTLRVST